MEVLRRVLLPVAWIVAVSCFASLVWPAQAQERELATVFVPSAGEAVAIEVVTPLRKKRDAFQKAETFKRLLLARKMRPMGVGDNSHYRGKCIVEPQQFELGEAILRVECWSFAMWADDDPFMTIGAPATAEEALNVIQVFLEAHSKRLMRPAPKQRDVVSRWRI